MEIPCARKGKIDKSSPLLEGCVFTVDLKKKMTYKNCFSKTHEIQFMHICTDTFLINNDQLP